MDVKIYPSFAHGEINCPASKSEIHRALICASLAQGRSFINNITLNDDIEATIDCLRTLGATIDLFDNQIVVEGIKNKNTTRKTLKVNESASTLRFLIPLSTLFSPEVIFSGDKNLFKRPLDVYEEMFTEQNLSFNKKADSLTLQGKLSSGTYLINGDVSSQFISGLLFYLPLLTEDSTIIIKKPFYSSGYVDLTISILKQFGIEIVRKNKYEIYIHGNQNYKATSYHSEIDYSQLAFWAGLAAINGEIVCNSIKNTSHQPDYKIIKILQKAQVKISRINKTWIFEKAKYTLKNTNINNYPDLGPVLACLATQSTTEVVITGIKRLIAKESNRLAAICDNLKKLSIETKIISANKLLIKPGKIKAHAPLDSHQDHRIFMAFAVLATISANPVIIQNAECISKSYPNFLEDLGRLGIKYEYLRNEELK